MFTLDPSIHPDIAPLAWLVGRWEGTGLLSYPTIESAQFEQEIVVTHDERPFLRWESRSWIVDESGERIRPAGTELGFWRPAGEGHAELLLTHPTGIVEMYYGTAEPARVELQTDGVIRSPQAKEYTAAKRMYGLVSSKLMWVMDMAAMGEPLTSHLSAELTRVED